MDPYNIVREAQVTAQSNPDKAAVQLERYLSAPEQWNRYAYAANNPLRYVDPDGMEEWEVQLLDNEKFKIRISDDIDKEERDAILENIKAAIAKINAGAEQLTPEEKATILSMQRIEVRTDIPDPGMAGVTFKITQQYAENPDLESLAAGIIHDSYHAFQNTKGKKSHGIEAEKEASTFAVPILEKLGLRTKIIEDYKVDAKEGHGPWGQKSRPPKKNTNK